MRYRRWAFGALGTMLLGLPAHAQHALQEQREQDDQQPVRGTRAAPSPIRTPPLMFVPSSPMLPPAPPAPPVQITRPAAPAIALLGPPAPPAPPRLLATTPLPAKLQGSSVYVYSFLDVRQEQYTSKVLDQFDADLTGRLATLKIGSSILRFRQSKMSRADEFYAGSYNQESREVPVLETVYGNLAEERAAHARFRLIVFPSNYTVSGAWRFYQIRFILMDAETGARLWSYEYGGKHLVMMKESENAEGRSKKILDKLFAELKAGGYL